MDFRAIVYILGVFIAVFGTTMAFPAIADLVTGNPDWQVFAAASAVTFFFGAAMVLSTWGTDLSLDLRQGFFLTTSSWVIVAIIGALPFMFAPALHLSFADAFFESMSGLTTTGSTVLSGLDSMPPGILLWRGALQWLGGIGIIVMAVAMLPFLKVGGMQLFRMESSDTADKVVPKAKTFMVFIVTIYVLLTVLCAALLDAAGMTPLEAIIHAMTTLSTGGYSTSDGSVGHFSSLTIHWIITIFMLMGAFPFVLYIQFFKGHPMALFGDSQVKALLGFLAAIIGLTTLWVWRVDHIAPFEALTMSAFNVISVVTTTGFASTDYSLWGSLPVELFLFLTFIGGCTGSTAGGIKIFRFEIMWLGLRQYLWRRLYPNGVKVMTYGRHVVGDDLVAGIAMFIFAFLLVTGLIGVVLSALGLDMVTALTGAATAMANVGPGLGAVIGPSGNFASLPDAAKYILTAAMLLGRLEIFTVLVLLQPAFWKR